MPPGRKPPQFTPEVQPPAPAEIVADGVLNFRQAGRFCGVSAATIRTLCLRSQLESFKVGNRRVIAKRELIRFLAAMLIQNRDLGTRPHHYPGPPPLTPWAAR